MNILVVSAHPDDEVLGAGGTLLKHKKKGDTIHWLIVTKVSVEGGFTPERIQSRQAEIEKVAKQLGVTKTHQLPYPTMTLSDSSLLTMIPEITSIVAASKPERIYVVNRSDAHSDHRITFQAVMACTKSFRAPFIKSVLMYECISETEFGVATAENMFIPNYYVDITEFFNEKIAITEIYESEIGQHPFPRSIKNIEALATFRGATAGVHYAEAFQLIKFIDK